MKRILILGCGSIGERHLRCFQKTGRAVVAACDANAALTRRMSEDHGVETYDDAELAMAQRFDAVVVCVPAHLHVRMSLLALQHSSSVLIEKPLAVTLDGVDGLVAAARNSGRYHAVAYVYHVMPWMLAARDYLAKGTIGRVLHASLVTGQHFPTYRPAYREIYYTRHETGGGAIQDALTHVINATEWLIGPITSLYADAAHQLLEGVTVEDTVNVMARHGDVLATYALNQFQAPNEMTLQLHGELGSVKVDLHRLSWSHMLRGQTSWTEHVSSPLERDDLFIAQASAFLDGMEGKPSPLCTLEEAVQTLKVNLAALESARTGQRITIP